MKFNLSDFKDFFKYDPHSAVSHDGEANEYYAKVSYRYGYLFFTNVQSPHERPSRKSLNDLTVFGMVTMKFALCSVQPLKPYAPRT